MNQNELDRLIERERNKPIPECPPALEANVLRRIRLARAESGERFGLDWLLGIFEQTRFAAAAVLAVLLLSTTASILASTAYASQAERRDRAASALDFAIFNEAKIVRLDK